ncbi:hypothetical protein DXG01_013460 [Tephrocybe rancida]|nr:hypothetical protein DXG01_013460 [Tephrocybe rancida]
MTHAESGQAESYSAPCMFDNASVQANDHAAECLPLSAFVGPSMSTQDAANGTSTRAPIPVLQRKTRCLDTKSITIMWDATESVSSFQVHKDNDDPRIADLRMRRAKEAFFGLPCDQKSPPCTFTWKVQLEQEIHMKSIEALDTQQHLNGMFLGKLSAG